MAQSLIIDSLPLRCASAGNDTLSRHGRARPGHPDTVRRGAFHIEITGTRPVMTCRGRQVGQQIAQTVAKEGFPVVAGSVKEAVPY